MLYHVTWYNMSHVIPCHMLYHVTGYTMSHVTPCHMLYHVTCYTMSHVILCHMLKESKICRNIIMLQKFRGKILEIFRETVTFIIGR